MEATIKTLATKDDLANLRNEMGNGISSLLKEMGSDLSNFRKEMSLDFSGLRKEMSNDISTLRKEMGENKNENIKWMFIFWVGQVGATLAIIFLFLKK